MLKLLQPLVDIFLGYDVTYRQFYVDVFLRCTCKVLWWNFSAFMAAVLITSWQYFLNRLWNLMASTGLSLICIFGICVVICVACCCITGCYMGIWLKIFFGSFFRTFKVRIPIWWVMRLLCLSFQTCARGTGVYYTVFGETITFHRMMTWFCGHVAKGATIGDIQDQRISEVSNLLLWKVQWPALCNMLCPFHNKDTTVNWIGLLLNFSRWNYIILPFFPIN